MNTASLLEAVTILEITINIMTPGDDTTEDLIKYALEQTAYLKQIIERD